MNELDGDSTEIKINDARKMNKNASKRRNPSLTSLSLNEKNGTLTMDTCNIANVQIKYYIINAEIMFSRAPFLRDSAESFSYVKPFLTITDEVSIEQEGETKRREVPIPESLQNKNLVIEILCPESGT